MKRENKNKVYCQRSWQTLTYIYFGNIGSTGNGTTKKDYQDLWKQDQINLLSYEWDFTMICDVLKLFFQNIHKNSLIANTILKTQISFDIIFI